jgi:hypothetical protein
MATDYLAAQTLVSLENLYLKQHLRPLLATKPEEVFVQESDRVLRRFRCPSCRQLYAYRSGLRRHLRRAHAPHE